MIMDREKRGLRRIEKVLEAFSGFFFDAFFGLGFNGISGDYAEFGSCGGTTMWLAYAEIIHSPIDRHMWVFDSFAGLPVSDDPRDVHPYWKSGTMRMSLEEFHAKAEERGVPRSAYTTVEGFYETSLPPLGESGAPTDIALAFIDCDMYSSTKEVLRFLGPRLKHGMILAFDDYYCWTKDRVSGEREAFMEFTAAHPEWRFYRYHDFGWGGSSFVVERR